MYRTNLDQVFGPWLGERAHQCYNLNEGFHFVQNDLHIVNELREQFLDVLKSDGFTVHDFGNINRTTVVEKNSIRIWINYHDCSIFSKNGYEEICRFVAVFDKYFVINSDKRLDIFYYVHVKGEAVNRCISLKRNDIPHTHPELYANVYIDKLVPAFNDSDEPIMLLYGEPGVGKTQFLRYLLKNGQYKSIAYVKDMDVMIMGDFWSSIASNNHDLIVFDDLDFALSPRHEGSDNTFLSNLLSYSDGIFSNQTKIIITTNQPINRIDGALIRPGRCFDFLTLESLTYEDGLAIWTTILGMDNLDYENLYGGLKRVSQAAIMSDSRRLKDRTIEREYIKSGNRKYSIEQKFAQAGIAVSNNNERIGLK